jgi:hypothetical protein
MLCGILVMLLFVELQLVRLMTMAFVHGHLFMDTYSWVKKGGVCGVGFAKFFATNSLY